MGTKEAALLQLAEQAKVLVKPGTNLVFGEGNPEAKVMFIGEAPGFHEDRLGRPFVGAAGKLLDRLLAQVGLKREDVYIANVLKVRPPGNRDPFPEEIAEAAPYLEGQIEIVNPQLIVTLGRFSMGKFLPGVKITQVHGVPKKVGQWLVVPMFHPAAALRAGKMMKMFVEDFEKLPQIIEAGEFSVGEEDPNQLSLI